MENNQERHTTFSPSDSNFIAVEEDRNQIGRTTTNELSRQNQMSQTVLE